jgi:hypothetical protein
MADGRWLWEGSRSPAGKPEVEDLRDRARGKSEHLQTTCRVEHAGAWFARAWLRKVSQKTNRPAIGAGESRRRKLGKGEKAG